MPFIPGFKEEGVPKREAVLLPDGLYQAKVISCESRNDKNGNEYWEIKLNVDGRTIRDMMFFTEKALRARTYPMLSAFGFDIHNDLNLSNPGVFIERYCMVDIISEFNSYKGKIENIVKPFGGYHEIDVSTATSIEKKSVVENELDETPF